MSETKIALNMKELEQLTRTALDKLVYEWETDPCYAPSEFECLIIYLADVFGLEVPKWH